MNKIRIIIIFLVVLTANGVVYGQNNLEIIDYYESVRTIFARDYALTSIPIIAIIDRGVNTVHEDLQSNIWTNSHEIPGNNIDDDQNGYIDDINGWNFATNTADITNNGIGNWHGTPVNGIIGAVSYNGLGINGICPKIRLMNIVKGENIETIISSLKYVYDMRERYNRTNGKSGAYVVALNCSWGKDSLQSSNYPEWCAMYDSLGNVGILSIHSVPNDNINVDIHGDMPASCKSKYLITVTNTNQYDEKIYDAGYGKHSVDIAAPGNNSYTTLNSGKYGYFGGTSAAAPYVAATVGLIHLLPINELQKHINQKPKETATLIKSVIINATDNNPNLENITVSGGRLNTFNSIKLICDHFNEQKIYQNLFEPLKIISIYPNPATEKSSLLIESNENIKIIISINNITGKTINKFNSIVNKGINKIPINLSNTTKGVYVVNLISGKISKNIKLIKC